MHSIQSVAVYCASSSQVRQAFFGQAFRLGKLLAEAGIRLVYGDGSIGLMGEISRGALESGGEVVGVIPRFMVEQGWNNPRSTRTFVVETMHERKAMIEKMADAMVALPGGIGTMEELLECLTWKQLGLHTKPVVILNIDGYFDQLLAFIDKMVDERMIRSIHKNMFTVVTSADDVIPALQAMPAWDASVRREAAI